MWSATTKDNLSAKVAVPLYCNTDWPLLVNDPNWPGRPQWRDGARRRRHQRPVFRRHRRLVPDQRHQVRCYPRPRAHPRPTPTTTIRGSRRRAPPARSTSIGCLSTKTLWCDNTSPYWPDRRHHGTLTGCTDGVRRLPDHRTPNLQARVSHTVCNPTAALRTYDDRLQHRRSLRYQRDLVLQPPGHRTLAPECLRVHLRHRYAERDQLRLSPRHRRQRLPAASGCSCTGPTLPARTSSRRSPAAPQRRRRSIVQHSPTGSVACSVAVLSTRREAIRPRPLDAMPARPARRARRDDVPPQQLDLCRRRGGRPVQVPRQPVPAKAPARRQLQPGRSPAAARRSARRCRFRATTTWSTRSSSATTGSSPRTTSGGASAPASARTRTTFTATRT